MKLQKTYHAVAIKPFMICGEVALPGEEVELLGTEYKSLLFNKKIRALTEKELKGSDPDDAPEDDKKGKK